MKYKKESKKPYPRHFLRKLGSFVKEHNGDIVADWKHEFALTANETVFFIGEANTVPTLGTS